MLLSIPCIVGGHNELENRRRKEKTQRFEHATTSTDSEKPLHPGRKARWKNYYFRRAGQVCVLRNHDLSRAASIPKLYPIPNINVIRIQMAFCLSSQLKGPIARRSEHPGRPERPPGWTVLSRRRPLATRSCLRIQADALRRTHPINPNARIQFRQRLWCPHALCLSFPGLYFLFCLDLSIR